MKLIKSLILIAIFLSLSIAFSPNSVLAQNSKTEATSAANIDAYAMFWPLVPGKTMGDSMYSLKLFKETLGEFFSFGDLKKAEYYTTISEKRLLEAQKLFLENKDYKYGAKTLEQNNLYQKKSFDLIKKAEKAQQKVEAVKGKLTTSLSNQQTLLTFIQTQVPEDQKSQFDKALKDVNNFLTLLP